MTNANDRLCDTVKAAAFDAFVKRTNVIHFIKKAGDKEFVWVNPAFRKFFGNGGDINHPRLLRKDEWKTDQIHEWEKHDATALKEGFWSGIELVPQSIGKPVSDANPLQRMMTWKRGFIEPTTGDQYIIGTAVLDIINEKNE